MEINRIEYALWLVRQVADVLAYFWPITLGLLSLLLLGFVQTGSGQRPIQSMRAWLIPLGTGPLLLVLLGTLLERSAEGTAETHPSVVVIWAVALLNIPLACFFAYRARANPAFAAGAALFTLWLTAASWFPAVMSVTGDWL